MNKVILMGRLTKDPEVKYVQSANTFTVARYTLAVNRRFKRDGEPDADFIGCVAFGKSAEFVEKYLKKGQQIAINGRLQLDTWTDQSGNKHYSTNVVAEEHYFCGNKTTGSINTASADDMGFYPTEEGDVVDDDFPFR